MKKLNESFIEVKKSKFIGYIYSIESIDEVAKIISNLKEEQSTEGKVINLGATILLKTNNAVTSYLTLSNKAFPQFDITYYLYK